MNFIAPYFAFQYSEVLIQSLKAQDIETVKLLSQQELPQIETLENEYYYDTKIYLNDQLQEMDTLKNDSRLYIMSERELAMQVSDKVIELYNSLPDYFLPMRDDMAVSLRNTSQAMAAQGRREGAAVLLKQASKLKLNQALQKDVKSMQKQINPLLGNLPLFLMIGLGVVFLLFLIKWIESTFWPS
jgi:thiol:disulfide interchange protein